MKDVHVTLYDVAARAGVSASTASRALAGLPVSRKARAAVEQAATDMGYVPNEAARSLRVVRTMTVGMVFYQLTSRLGIELLGAMTTGLERQGYSLFVSTAQGEAARYDQLVRRFLERRVDALVCVHGRGDGAALERYQAAGIPALALITQGGGYERLPLITSRIGEAARECVEALLALGHRRIGVATTPRPVHLVEDVLAAVRGSAATLVELPALDAAATLARLQAPDAPTAVIALQGEAVRMLQAADAAGVSVPQAVSLVAIRDRSEVLEPTRVSLAMIHVDPTPMGAAAAEALGRWLDDKTPLTGRTLIEAGAWRPGGSVGPAPAR